MNSYSRVHAHRTNLLIHLVAVPLFILAHVGLVAAIAYRKPLPALTCIGVAMASLGLQRKGHALEVQAPAPFSSGWNFAARLYTEQFYAFPRFVVSGEFQESWLGAQSQEHS
ncbi:MAG: Mpo1-like protein [Cyanobacteria bacterium P01_H01_bin.58]